MEFIQEGVIAVSHHLKPVYMNSKARDICQKLWKNYDQADYLPPIIGEIVCRVMKEAKQGSRAIVMMDYKFSEEQTIRIRAHHLSFQLDVEPHYYSENSPRVMIFLQDRSAILQEELRIEQQKYNLSDRETQILRFLQQLLILYKSVSTL
jgi:hypothetical protein